MAEVAKKNDNKVVRDLPATLRVVEDKFVNDKGEEIAFKKYVVLAKVGNSIIDVDIDTKGEKHLKTLLDLVFSGVKPRE